MPDPTPDHRAPENPTPEDACGHWLTIDIGGEHLICDECGARLPIGWHDTDEDERDGWL